MSRLCSFFCFLIKVIREQDFLQKRYICTQQNASQPSKIKA
nr:MAG TPA: hypothetical protein [Caudoviricetes sp.]